MEVLEQEVVQYLGEYKGKESVDVVNIENDGNDYNKKTNQEHPVVWEYAVGAGEIGKNTFQAFHCSV